MAEKKFKEAEKSSLTISFNSKEESLLKKKILSLDLMKKQATDSLTLDQKLLYNNFTLKLRRSELAHARLIGNTALMKRLAYTMFSSFNTTVNDGTENAVRAILQNRKPSRAVSAPCRPNSWMSENGKIYKIDANHGHNSRKFSARKSYANTPQRLYSAPGRQQSLNRQPQVKFFKASESRTKNPDFVVQPRNLARHGEENITDKAFFKSKAEKQEMGMPVPQSLVRKRPKSTSFLLDIGGMKLQGSSNTMANITDDREKMCSSKVKTFIEKVKSLQQNDPTLKDYYSQRMFARSGNKELSSLTCNVDEREQNQWLLTGEEFHHRSVTMKKLDTNFTRKDVPTDILFMEQYNLVLTKENYSVRNWINNNPYISAK